MPLQRPSGHVALLTDFGHRDAYVGVMKGAILRACSTAVLVDLCHEVPPQQLAVGGLFLRAAVGHFPPGTVVVAVVDPGVGTARRVLAAHAHELFWLAPDNGLLGEVLAAAAAAEVRAVDLPHLGIAADSPTFHGRDVFARVAGWLAGGRYGFQSLGPRTDDWVRLSVLAGRQVVHVDGFGNLITNVAAAELRGVRSVRIAGRTARVVATYGAAAKGELIALVGSMGLVEVAVAQGSAAALLGAGWGTEVALT
ncbi:MAG TPA: SAM-dependent chlorinase/fluorinase [Planctomycetota bacterium]|nr:SAM-dependent chlorinase/fluorinase [Planctomycetota bacterium]